LLTGNDRPMGRERGSERWQRLVQVHYVSHKIGQSPVRRVAGRCHGGQQRSQARVTFGFLGFAKCPECVQVIGQAE